MPAEEPRLRRDLTKGSIVSAIFILALPMMLGNLLRTTYDLADLWFVGRLGKEAVAAVVMSGHVLFFLNTVFMGIGTAATAMVSRAIGAGDQERANHAAAQALLLTFLAAIVVAAVGMILAPYLLILLKAPPENVLGLATSYLRIMFLGLLGMFSLFVGAGILRGAGDAVTPLLVSAFGTLLNIVLDPILIFGWWVFPRLGVKGAAMASVTAQYVAFLIGMLVLASGRVRVRLTLRAFKPDFEYIRSAVVIGVPSSVQMSLRALMGLVLTRVVNAFGTTVYAAYGICMRLQGIGFMPTFGIAAASATLVGQNLGAKKPERAQRSALLSTAIALAIMGTAGIIAYIFAPQLVALFVKKDPEVVPIGARFIRVAVFGHVAAGIGIVISRAINGAGDTVPPMLFTLVVLWGVQVPLAVWLANSTSLGAGGVLWAAVIAGAVHAGCSTTYFFTGRWKRKRIWKHADADVPADVAG